VALPLLETHVAELQSASTPIVAVAAIGSFVGQLAAVVEAAPLWVYVVAAVAPWVPLLGLEIYWTFRHYRWLGLFCLLIVTQSGYLLQQVARVVQTDGLGRAPQAAPGLIGVFGIERVHLVWLARAFPRLPERVLIEATGQLEEIRLRPGEMVEQDLERWLIVTSGRGLLVRTGPGGHEILLGVLGPGQVVRDPGTVCADSPLELLALPNGAV
jgi:hypothetical protein